MVKFLYLLFPAYFVFSSASFGEDPGAFADILGPYEEAGLHTCLNFWFWYEVLVKYSWISNQFFKITNFYYLIWKPGNGFDKFQIISDGDTGRYVFAIWLPN